MATNRTKAVVALGVLDMARQVTRAWSAREQAERDRAGIGGGTRRDATRIARDARGKLPDRLEWGMPPWRRTPTFADRARTWLPIAIVVAACSAAVVLAARVVARHEPDATSDATMTDTRVVGAVRAGGRAIDAGVTKVVDGGSAAAVGTASAVAAGSTAVRAAAVKVAKDQLDERVVAPAKHKAIVFGSLGLVGLTAYVVLVAVLVYLAIALIT